MLLLLLLACVPDIPAVCSETIWQSGADPSERCQEELGELLNIEDEILLSVSRSVWAVATADLPTLTPSEYRDETLVSQLNALSGDPNEALFHFIARYTNGFRAGGRTYANPDTGVVWWSEPENRAAPWILLHETMHLTGRLHDVYVEGLGWCDIDTTGAYGMEMLVADLFADESTLVGTMALDARDGVPHFLCP